METIAELTAKYASSGTVSWIGIRPARRAPMAQVSTIAISESGLEGDHYASGGKRAVTLVQQEHLAVIASLAGKSSVEPAMLRRNLVIAGINLLGLRKRRFRIGSAILEGTGLCAPCSRMEETLGHGGYAAVRGHGGITARIVSTGKIATGDKLLPC